MFGHCSTVYMKGLNPTRRHYQAGNYMLKINNRNTRARCEICSKITIKTPELCQWRHSGCIDFSFKNMLHMFT